MHRRRTAARAEVETAHVESEIDKECVKAERIKGLSRAKKIQKIPLYQIYSMKTKQLADKIGKLIIHVYNDAKHLRNSAFSWPSLVVASEKARKDSTSTNLPVLRRFII